MLILRHNVQLVNLNFCTPIRDNPSLPPMITILSQSMHQKAPAATTKRQSNGIRHWNRNEDHHMGTQSNCNRRPHCQQSNQ